MKRMRSLLGNNLPGEFSSFAGRYLQGMIIGKIIGKIIWWVLFIIVLRLVCVFMINSTQPH